MYNYQPASQKFGGSAAQRQEKQLNFIEKAGTAETTGNPVRPRRNWIWLGPPLAYFGLALLLTWPLALHSGDSIPRGEPDSWQNIWNFWWMRHSLFERHANPFWTDLLFYPYRVNPPLGLYYHTLQPAISLPGALLSAVLGYALTYNLVIFFGFVATGWAMYALAYYFVQNRVAAFVAGAFYTFSVFHWHNLAQGQTSVFWLQWLPLYLWLLHKSIAPLRGERSGRQYPLLAGVVLALTIYTDLYYTLYLLLYSAILFGWRLFLSLKTGLKKSQGTGDKSTALGWRELVGRVALILVVWGVAAAPLLFGMLTHRNDPAIQYSEGIEIPILQSAALASFFTPLRGTDRGWLPYFIGYTTLALAFFGVLRGGRKGGWWLLLALGSLVMALGPYLRLDQQEPVEQALKNLPLPYRLFSELPLINNSRSPIRFMALAQLGLAMLAGWGVLWLSEQFARLASLKRYTLPVVSGLALLIFGLETNVLPLALEKLPQPALFSQIKNEPNYALLELPITLHYIEDSKRMYYQTLHEHPISSGYISRKVFDYQRDPSSPFGYFFDVFPSKPEPIFVNEKQNLPLRILNYYNFGYVINYKQDYKPGNWQFSDTEKYLQELFGHGPDYQDELMTAYRVPTATTPQGPILWRTSGFYEVEKRADGVPFRWARPSDPGSTLEFLNPANVKVNLKFSAWSFGMEDDLLFRLDGKEIGRVHLTPAPQDYNLELNLPAGAVHLELKTAQPFRTPAQVGGNAADKRQLSFALAQVQLIS